MTREERPFLSGEMQRADGVGGDSAEIGETERILRLLPAPLRDQQLDTLIEISRTKEGRSELSGLNLVPHLLALACSLLARPSDPASGLIVTVLRLVRNLCAGDAPSQDSFVTSGGPETVALAIDSGGSPDVVILGFQVSANVAVAGEAHRASLWGALFPARFWRGLCFFDDPRVFDPLCRVLHLCVSEDLGMLSQLCGIEGLPIMVELIRKSQNLDGVEAQWLQLLLRRICLELSCFSQMYSGLGSMGPSNNGEINFCEGAYSTEQASLLHGIADSLNQQGTMLLVSKDVAMFIFNIFRSAADAIRDIFKRLATLPTDSPVIDILRYSLRIIRDICAMEDPKESSLQESSLLAKDNPQKQVLSTVDLLVSAGLVIFMLGVLQDLEDPPIMKKSRAQVNHNDLDLAKYLKGQAASQTSENAPKSCSQEEPITKGMQMLCPYKGFRSDIVAVIANSLYGRKHVQDEIRRQGGIFLLLQQSGIDEDNPFLREWGYWAARNLFEDNDGNKREVAEQELQGVANSPEISALGLQVKIDPESGRVKLVNVAQ